LFSLFAIFALVLAAVGLYAVMAYGVNQRTREIGVRMAMGASRGSIMKLVLRAGLWPVAIGMTLGLGASAAATRVLQGLLVHVTPWQRSFFVALSSWLVGVARAACAMRARKGGGGGGGAALRKEKEGLLHGPHPKKKHDGPADIMGARHSIRVHQHYAICEA